MSQKVYIVCGPSGIGKTWVCEQLKDQYEYVPHDIHDVKEYPDALEEAANTSQKPVVGEAPFRTSVLVNELRQRGIKCEAIYIVEPEHVWESRVMLRDGALGVTERRIKQYHHLKNRAAEVGDYVASAQEVLTYLKARGSHA